MTTKYLLRRAEDLVTPYVTILPQGGFIFNSSFVRKANVEDATHVVLGYSEVSGAVGFKFTEDAKAPGVYKLSKGVSNRQVGCKPFFTYRALDPEKLRGRYVAVKRKAGKTGAVWVIYLDEKIESSIQT